MATRNEQKRRELVHALFTTAMEGGITYWADIDEYRWSVPGSEPQVEDVDGFVAKVLPSEGEWGVFDDEDKASLTIDRAVVERGLERWIEWLTTGKRNSLGAACEPGSDKEWRRDPYSPSGRYWRQFLGDLQAQNWDAVDYDADIADAIVQLGLFDKVVYG
ncbi:hypothetical protein SEA_CEPENS_78 [Mycobacterium phage Cepens]|nr:hypothetical protein PBI_MEGABEAR_76 [Mycobacterium phage Megabear]QBP32738.1 hypothetical protein SEA_CEPENS_78 [Mycobacterium phage Cepens]